MGDGLVGLVLVRVFESIESRKRGILGYYDILMRSRRFQLKARLRGWKADRAMHVINDLTTLDQEQIFESFRYSLNHWSLSWSSSGTGFT